MTDLPDSNPSKRLQVEALVSAVEDMRLWEPHTKEHKAAERAAFRLAEALADSNPGKRPA